MKRRECRATWQGTGPDGTGITYWYAREALTIRTVRRNSQIPGRWQRAAERLDQLLVLPMLVLTLAFLAVLILPVLVPDLPPGAREALDAIDLGPSQ